MLHNHKDCSNQEYLSRRYYNSNWLFTQDEVTRPPILWLPTYKIYMYLFTLFQKEEYDGGMFITLRRNGNIMGLIG